MRSSYWKSKPTTEVPEEKTICFGCCEPRLPHCMKTQLSCPCVTMKYFTSHQTQIDVGQTERWSMSVESQTLCLFFRSRDRLLQRRRWRRRSTGQQQRYSFDRGFLVQCWNSVFKALLWPGSQIECGCACTKMKLVKTTRRDRETHRAQLRVRHFASVRAVECDLSRLALLQVCRAARRRAS